MEGRKLVIYFLSITLSMESSRQELFSDTDVDKFLFKSDQRSYRFTFILKTG